MRVSALLIVCCALSFAATADDFPGGAPLGIEHPNFTNGYYLAALYEGNGNAHLCVKGAPGIERKQGAIKLLDNAPSGIKGEVWDSQEVLFECSNMYASARYMLGFTWWSEEPGRRVSVRIGGPGHWKILLAGAQPIAYHADKSTFARVQIPVEPDDIYDGHTQISFTRDAGSGVSVNELWLLQREDAPLRARILIVTGDDYAGHLWRATGPSLASALREDPRLEVTITESPAFLASPRLRFFDAVVLHFKDYQQRLPLGKDVWDGLEQYVADGRGVALVHFGCGAFEAWSGFVNVAGRVWDPQKRGHDPYGKFQVRIAPPPHAITAGLTDFETEDELYTCLKGDPPLEILCEATSRVDQQTYPMAFVVPRDKARVFHCTLGHDANALNAPGTRALYRRAVAWCAGLPPNP